MAPSIMRESMIVQDYQKIKRPKGRVRSIAEISVNDPRKFRIVYTVRSGAFGYCGGFGSLL